MLEHPGYITTIEDLRAYVQEQLCDQNQLEVGAFQLTERVLEKGGAPCGIVFCLHGPRSAKLIAIWESGMNTVLFYSSRGERIGRIQLAHAPSLACDAPQVVNFTRNHSKELAVC